MKILCFIDSLGSGGAQRQLIELAKGFLERGHKVTFLTYHDINFFKPELDELNVSVHTIIEPNYLKRLLKVRKYIRQGNSDAVLAFLEASSFMATMAGFPWRKWKLVVGERSANPNILKSAKLKFYRWCHIFADHIVANSHANLKIVKEINPFLPKRKLQVIYNIVDVKASIEERNSKILDKVRIVVAASYRPVKNVDGLLKAIDMLPQEYKNKLVVDWYGNKEDVAYFERMEQKIKDYSLKDIVKFNPATRDIFLRYSESDFVGLFSHYEGFPNTICEAMALNKPIIATQVSDVPCFLEEGINGYLCKSSDPSSIKNALVKAMESTEKERLLMGSLNEKITKRDFDKKTITNKYLQLLTK